MDQKIIISQRKEILIHAILYNIIWYLCIKSATSELLWFYTAISFLLLCAQVIYYKICHPKFQKLLTFVATLSFLGCCLDSALCYFKLFHFKASFFYCVSPAYLLIIWLSFSVMFYALFKSLFKRHILVGLLSFFGFSFSYFLGSKLGAATPLMGVLSYLIVGLIWMLLLPSFLYIFKRANNHEL